MSGRTKAQVEVQVPQAFFDNFEELASDPITSPLEAWTELQPPASHMEQPIGPYPPGGGLSSGAGAGDMLEDPSLPDSQSQQENYQIPLSVLDPNTGLNVVQGGYFSTSPNYGVNNPNYVYNPLEEAGFSQNWQAVGGAAQSPPASSSLQEPLSPLGEIEQPVKSNNSSSHPPSKRNRWTDFYYDSVGRKIWTRAPHTYYQQKPKHSRDICHVVANRSHNGGKGASRGTIVRMIRAYYYCKGG